MKRLSPFISVVAAAASLAVGLSGAPGAPRSAGRSTKVGAAESSLGQIIGAGWYAVSPAGRKIDGG
jgi:hypothetical protein